MLNFLNKIFGVSKDKPESKYFSLFKVKDGVVGVTHDKEDYPEIYQQLWCEEHLMGD